MNKITKSIVLQLSCQRSSNFSVYHDFCSHAFNQLNVLVFYGELNIHTIKNCEQSHQCRKGMQHLLGGSRNFDDELRQVKLLEVDALSLHISFRSMHQCLKKANGTILRLNFTLQVSSNKKYNTEDTSKFRRYDSPDFGR